MVMAVVLLHDLDDMIGFKVLLHGLDDVIGCKVLLNGLSNMIGWKQVYVCCESAFASTSHLLR